MWSTFIAPQETSDADKVCQLTIQQDLLVTNLAELNQSDCAVRTSI